MNPGDDLDQGGLAGPVLTEQRVYLARQHVEIDLLQHPDPREGLRHASELHQRVHREPTEDGHAAAKRTAQR
jgi:hypothetical protein